MGGGEGAVWREIVLAGSRRLLGESERGWGEGASREREAERRVHGRLRACGWQGDPEPGSPTGLAKSTAWWLRQWPTAWSFRVLL